MNPLESIPIDEDDENFEQGNVCGRGLSVS
jgi:hypothetical protein